MVERAAARVAELTSMSVEVAGCGVTQPSAGGGSAMHVIRQYDFGPADNLRYEELPDPHPGQGQVRIAVRAAGVHLLDTAIRAGITAGGPLPRPELPMVPGREVAGVVDEVGSGVDQAWLVPGSPPIWARPAADTPNSRSVRWPRCTR